MIVFANVVFITVFSLAAYLLRRFAHPRRVKTLALAGVLFASAAVEVQAQSMQYVPVITTFAGGATTVCSGATNSIGDGCLATEAILKSPWNSTSDAAGNVYIADSVNNVIRRVDAATGGISTVAGGATLVCATATNGLGDGCPALQAMLSGPAWVRFDPAGDLVIADRANHRVRLVDRKSGIIKTIVGTGVTGAVASNSKPLPSASTPCSDPTGLAFDRAGNLYVTCSARFYTALVVAVNGVIDGVTSLMYDFAGNGTSGYKGDGGVASSGEINGAQGLAVDAAGNVYIGDYQNYVVRKVTSPFQNGALNLSGSIISTFAGTSTTAGNSGDGGLATAALIGNGRDANVDNSGKVYISSYQISGGSGGDEIRVVDPNTNIINTFAGNSSRATTGDGGPAVLGSISGPYATSFDNNGSAFIDAYVGNDVRRVSLDNTFFGTPVGGTGLTQNIVAQAMTGFTLKSAVVSPATGDFALGALSGCATGTELAAQAYCTLPVNFAPVLPGMRTARLTLSDGTASTSLGLSGIGYAPLPGFSGATITTTAGTGVAGLSGNPGSATAAQLSGPRGGVVDAQGNLYIADTGNNVIRKIDSSGTISIVAGTGASAYTGDGGAATSATLNAPSKVTLDSAGNLYIADTGNNAIRFVNVDTGVITTIAGNGTATYTGDGGVASAATLNHPQGVAVDAGGNVYVADTGNHVIRRFVAGGPMITLAGTGTAGFSGDGGAPALAQLNAPAAVALDAVGNLYIADTGNAVIRDIEPTGYITTVAGVAGGTANTGDGGLATSASLLTPTDVVADAGGDLYIAAGNVVRSVNSAGTISTYAGTGASGSYSGENGPSTLAGLGASAKNLFVDGSFNVYISATSSNRLVELSGSSPRMVNFGSVTPATSSSAQSVTLSNTGNSNLVLSGLSVSASYSLQTTASNACTSTSVIVPGGSCVISVVFTPSASANGVITGSITITDNAVNASAATQSIPLTGTALVVAATKTTVTVSPASPVYGAAATATATVSGGTSASGTVNFTANGVSIATVALTSGNVTVNLPLLSAGQSVISASYSGDSANSSSTGSATVSIQPAVLTVTASNTSFAQRTALPTLAYAISGFVNGDTSSVVSGTPAESTTATISSAVGTYPITLSLGTLSAANYTFTFVNGTLTVQAGLPPDFTISASPSSFTVAAGQTATTTLSLVSLSDYTGTAQLSCSGLPANSTCTFLATNLTGDPTASAQTVSTQLYISTDSNQHVSSLEGSPTGRTPLVWEAVMSPLLLFGLLAHRRKKTYAPRLLAAVICMITAIGFSGCGSSDVKTAAPGTYSITVTATDGSSKLTHSAVITVVVH